MYLVSPLISAGPPAGLLELCLTMYDRKKQLWSLYESWYRREKSYFSEETVNDKS